MVIRRQYLVSALVEHWILQSSRGQASVLGHRLPEGNAAQKKQQEGTLQMCARRLKRWGWEKGPRISLDAQSRSPDSHYLDIP